MKRNMQTRKNFFLNHETEKRHKKIKIQKKNEIKNKDLAKIQVIFIKRL